MSAGAVLEHEAAEQEATSKNNEASERAPDLTTSDADMAHASYSKAMAEEGCAARAPEREVTSRVPSVAGKLERVSKLTSKAPSPLLAHTCSALLWAYALAQRRCYSDIAEDDLVMLQEFAECFMTCGGHLLVAARGRGALRGSEGSGACKEACGEAECSPAGGGVGGVPTSAVQGIEECLARCQVAYGRHAVPLALLLELTEDVDTLYSRKTTLLAALAHARSLLTALAGYKTRAGGCKWCKDGRSGCKCCKAPTVTRTHKKHTHTLTRHTDGIDIDVDRETREA